MIPNFKGDICQDQKTLSQYSHDASIFEIKPTMVLFPKDSSDVQSVVMYVNAKNSEGGEKLSITARSAGTDMSGGAIGASIILDFTRYMNAICKIEGNLGTVQPGCYYRDFEKETIKSGYIVPTYPASREICAVGGMVANNGGGEKSIKYGKTGDHIASLKVVCSDGKEYEIKPISRSELQEKISRGGFEGSLYEQMWQLIDTHYNKIMAAKPDVSKNSAGYYLWNVYDKEHDVFDVCRVIAGSQGTLGIITEITFRLTIKPTHANILTVFLPDLSHTSQLVNELLPFKPESLETYDDYSMKLALQFFFDFYKQLGLWGLIQLGWQFIPEARMMLTGGLPKLMLMAEFTGNSFEEVNTTIQEAEKHIQHFGYKTHIAKSEAEAQKYWKIRRESFNLLRKHIKGKRTAAFIDDIIVKPEYLPEFMPKLQAILAEYKLVYTIAGHLGNGNFHIIPLMDFKDTHTKDIILELSKKVYDLVIAYKGSITAEHNDGIIRTPYLPLMFGNDIYDLFKQTKHIFDPNNILNPGKKVDGTFDDIRKHMVTTS